MNLKVKAIVAVLIVAVLGVGGALASRAWDPLWNPFRPAPDKVVEKAIEASQEVETNHLNGSMEVKLNKGSGKVDFEGDMDNSDPEKPKSRLKLDVSISGEGMEFSTRGEIRSFENVLYAKVSEIPAVPMLPPQQVDRFKNQWIKFDSEESEAAAQQPQMDPEQIRKVIKEKLDLEKLLKVNKEFPDEKVNGVSSYHYLVEINEEEFKQTVPELAEALQELSQQAKPVDKKKMRENIGEFFNKAGPLQGEVWIGKKDFLVRKFKFDKKFENLPDQAQAAKFDLSFEIYFSDFGKSINIKVPEGAKTLLELMREMMGPLFGTQFPSDQLPEGTQIPEGYNIPQGTEVPQLP